MVGMAGFPMTENSIRSQIASAIRIVVQLYRFADGKRRVTSISEVVGLNGGAIVMQEIFKLVRAKPGMQGALFQATGVTPSFLETLELNGATFPEDTFRPGAAL
jgi:pilus assembly protein CpaF